MTAVTVFFVMNDLEVDTLEFFASESLAQAKKEAWLRAWGKENELDDALMTLDQLESEALDEGYDCYICSGSI